MLSSAEMGRAVTISIKKKKKKVNDKLPENFKSLMQRGNL